MGTTNGISAFRHPLSIIQEPLGTALHTPRLYVPSIQGPSSVWTLHLHARSALRKSYARPDHTSLEVLWGYKPYYYKSSWKLVCKGWLYFESDGWRLDLLQMYVWIQGRQSQPPLPMRKCRLRAWDMSPLSAMDAWKCSGHDWCRKRRGNKLGTVKSIRTGVLGFWKKWFGCCGCGIRCLTEFLAGGVSFGMDSLPSPG